MDISRLCLCWIAICTCFTVPLAPPSTAQGILGRDEESDANEFMAKATTAHLELPTEYATMMRVNTHRIGPTGVTESQVLRLYSENAKLKRKYVGWETGIQGNLGFSPVWIQHLHFQNQRHERFGSPIGPFGHKSESSSDQDTKFAKIIGGRLYPFHFAFATSIDTAVDRADRSYGQFLLQNLDFIDAKTLDNRLFETRWKRNKKQRKVVFDPHRENRPVKTIVYGVIPKNGSEEDRPIEEVQRITWERLLIKNNRKSVLVPSMFHRVVIDNDNDSQIETRCYLQWRDTTDKSVIPDAESKDWREPFRQLFDEDWSMSFDEWEREHLKRSEVR